RFPRTRSLACRNPCGAVADDAHSVVHVLPFSRRRKRACVLDILEFRDDAVVFHHGVGEVLLIHGSSLQRALALQSLIDRNAINLPRGTIRSNSVQTYLDKRNPLGTPVSSNRYMPYRGETWADPKKKKARTRQARASDNCGS